MYLRYDCKLVFIVIVLILIYFCYKLICICIWSRYLFFFFFYESWYDSLNVKFFQVCNRIFEIFINNEDIVFFNLF